jgi:16S rRNA (cytidine1402-2'-O)-methyltransferase
VTSRLLSIHGISRPLLSYNDHNAAEMRPRLLAKLKKGAVLALVSDAGTPLISDPGFKLVRAAREEAIPVFPVPGPSAALAALTVAGIASDRFLFAGFLPSKQAARRAVLDELGPTPASLIFYEAPQRLAETLADMADVLGARPAAVARELTKLHEEVRTGPLPDLAKFYAGAEVRGEITLVIAPPPEGEPDFKRIDELLGQALPFMPVKAASGLVADALGVARRLVYDRALVLKGEIGA